MNELMGAGSRWASNAETAWEKWKRGDAVTILELASSPPHLPAGTKRYEHADSVEWARVIDSQVQTIRSVRGAGEHHRHEICQLAMLMRDNAFKKKE